VLIVLEKEWLELRLQRTLLLATFFLPPLITAFAVAGFFFAGRFTASTIGSAAPLPPEFASLSQFELGQAILGRQLSTLFLLIPIFIPSVLASYAIGGEKRERTLEPVLATPIRTWELLLGKILGALVPALAITLASAAGFVAGILSFAVSDRVRAMIVTPGWVLAVLVDTPLLALIGVALIVVLSSRVNDPRNQPHFDLLGITQTVCAVSNILGLVEHEVPEHDLIHLLELRKENLEIVEVQIPKGAPSAGKKVEKLPLPEGARPLAVEPRVGQHIGPRSRGGRFRRGGDDVLAAVLRKAARPVESGQIPLRYLDGDGNLRATSSNRVESPHRDLHAGAAVQLLGERAGRVADDHTGDGLHQHLVLFRHLLDAADEDAARLVDQVRLGR